MPVITKNIRRVYGDLPDLYPVHWDRFCYMQLRARHFGTDFSDDQSGFMLFIEEIGPVPEGMMKPTVGRKDHSKGYIFGNFEWQEQVENSRESAYRIRPTQYVTKEGVAVRTSKLRGQIRTDEQKLRMSLWQKGKPMSEEHRQSLRDAYSKKDPEILRQRTLKSWETRRNKSSHA